MYYLFFRYIGYCVFILDWKSVNNRNIADVNPRYMGADFCAYLFRINLICIRRSCFSLLLPFLYVYLIPCIILFIIVSIKIYHDTIILLYSLFFLFFSKDIQGHKRIKTEQMCRLGFYYLYVELSEDHFHTNAIPACLSRHTSVI